MCEWDLISIRIRAIDVVEPDCVLRDYLQRAVTRLEHFRIDRIPQRGNQPVDARPDFFNDQLLRRRLWLGINLNLVSPLTKHI